MAPRFRADIQGLRAIAVVAVLLQHAGFAFFGGGFVGVDVFFVVSGFLITGMLVRELEASGRIDIPQFMARRVRRIIPAALVVALLTAAAGMLLGNALERHAVLGDTLASILFVPNYAFALRETDYFGDDEASLFQHYWSLGVEEQWYILCPLLLMATGAIALRAARRRGGAGTGSDEPGEAERRAIRRGAVLLLAVVSGASLVACIVVSHQSQPWAFFPVWTRAWEFGVGALAALIPVAALRRVPPPAAAVAGWAGLAGIVASVVLLSGDTVWPGAWALLPVLSTAAVILAGTARSEADEHGARWWEPAHALSTRPMMFLGDISYTLYLVHWPILLLATPLLPEGWVTRIGLSLASVAAAWGVTVLVERPLRHAPVLARARPRRSIGVGLAATAVASALVLATLTWAPLMRTATAAEVEIVAPSVPPVATQEVGANVEPSLLDAADDEAEPYIDDCNLGYRPAEPLPCAYGDPAGERVVLWGDSHAAHWGPAFAAMAETHGLAVETHTKSGCASSLARHELNGGPYESCDAWRQNVLEDLAGDPPDTLVVSSFVWDPGPEGEDAETLWRDGLREIVEALPDTRVVFSLGLPRFSAPPLDCLAENLDDALACAVPEQDAFGGPGDEAIREVAESTQAETLDVTRYLCGDIDGERLCPVVIGGRIAYRDAHHLTAIMSRALSDAVARELGYAG